MIRQAHVALLVALCAATACGGDDYSVTFTTTEEMVNVSCPQLYCVATSPASGTNSGGKLRMDGPELTVKDGCSGSGTRTGDDLNFDFVGSMTPSGCYSFEATIHVDGATLTGTWTEYSNPHGAGKRGTLSGRR